MNYQIGLPKKNLKNSKSCRFFTPLLFAFGLFALSGCQQAQFEIAESSGLAAQDSVLGDDPNNNAPDNGGDAGGNNNSGNDNNSNNNNNGGDGNADSGNNSGNNGGDDNNNNNDDDSGVNLQTVTDTYTQDPDGNRIPHKVDILWVIDNSGSMEDNQNNLADNFAAFVNNLTNFAVIPDFKMAVVTTDPRSWVGGDGQFVSNRILTRQELIDDPSQFVIDFQNLVRVGTDGSGSETDLLNMWRATQRTENQSFFRADALLAVNILSDEFDSSVNYTGRPVDFFVDGVKSFKNNERVLINSIVHFQTVGRYATQGAEQMEATRLTNGIAADIAGNFADALANIGEAILTLTTSFPLTNSPYNAGNIVVKVNGASNSDWSYNADLNTISFSVAPPAGALIEIQYQVQVQ